MVSQRTMARVRVRESEVEDALVVCPRILGELLGWDYDLSLVARQYALPSGRLDLLYISRNVLFLVELKVERFRETFIHQLLGYKKDLNDLQNSNGLVSGTTNAVLLATGFEPADAQACEIEGINLVSYRPDEVLKTFYQQMAGLSGFMNIRPVDLGVWNIHVINRVLYALLAHNAVNDVSQAVGISANTARNHLRFATQLGLVSKFDGSYLLTDLGQAFVELRDPSLSEFALADEQTDVLRQHIATDPFSSNIVFGIYSLVESVFTLARNSYPVKEAELLHFYRETVGKRYDWAAERSAFLGVNAFSNFAVELGLIARAGDNLLLTPSGFRFILVLQLHKGIKIVDSLGLGAER